MQFASSPEHDMLRDSVRAHLAEKMPMPHVRRLMETDAGYEAADWQLMAQQGWPGMHIPEEYGGAGFSMVELGIVLEEMGRAMTPSCLFATAVLAASTIMFAGSADHRNTLLPLLASGERTAAVALLESDGDWAVAAPTATAVIGQDRIVVNGDKSFVIDGHTASLLIVAVTVPDDGVRFVLVDADAPGVTVERIETMDMTRKQANVSLNDVTIEVAALLPVPVHEVLAEIYDVAAVALAYEQLGGAQRCMEMSVEYAKERMQFGRPIGSFQAIKHKCADMLVAVESARSAARYAGWAIAEEDPDRRIAAPLAKAACSDAFFQVASETIQVHGGIGFTWEHDAHLYFKRAKSSQLMFGSTGQWRATLADRLGL